NIGTYDSSYEKFPLTLIPLTTVVGSDQKFNGDGPNGRTLIRGAGTNPSGDQVTLDLQDGAKVMGLFINTPGLPAGHCVNGVGSGILVQNNTITGCGLAVALSPNTTGADLVGNILTKNGQGLGGQGFPGKVQGNVVRDNSIGLLTYMPNADFGGGQFGSL